MLILMMSCMLMRRCQEEGGLRRRRWVRLEAVDYRQALPSIGLSLPRPSGEVRLSDEQDGKVDPIIIVDDI